MNTTLTTPDQDWLLLPAIIGGFFIVFPLFWCLVVWMLSRGSGWHRLAARHASGSRPVTGVTCGGVTGMVGGGSYRGTLTLHFDTDGFFLEVMPLFRIGHPRVFIPWSEISGRQPFTVLWWKAVRLSVGQPVIATISLPAALLEKHAPA